MTRHSSTTTAGRRSGPSPVDGNRWPRPCDAKPFRAAAIGQVHLAGLDDGRATRSVRLLLQGLLVYGDAQLDRDSNIVHLDPCRFHARLPQRDALVDEVGVLHVVETVLKAMWREHLEEAKRTLAGEVFVTRFFNAAATWGAGDLFADVGLLPGRVFARITGYPIQEGHGRAAYLQALPGLLRREQFASGQLRAVVLPEPQTDNFAYWMFARTQGLFVLTRSWGLAEGHWLWDYVPALDAQPAEVEILDERARAMLSGQWIAPEVILCRGYRVRIPGHDDAELTEQAMAWRGRHGGEALIIVPDGEHRGDAVAQCSSYIGDDDRPHPELAAQDCDALADLIRRLRALGDACRFLPAPGDAQRPIDPERRQAPSERWRSRTSRPSAV
jgi:hypothetical protein